MKTLLILRHGKAEENNPGGDRKRNLTARGQRDAGRVGQELRARDAVPDLIVSSDAARARQTAAIAAEACDYAGEIKIEPDIYDGGVDGIVKLLQRLPNDAERIMLVGHNPTLETLIAALDDPDAAEVLLPTAGLACMELDIRSWAGLRLAAGRVLWHVTPKSVEAET